MKSDDELATSVARMSSSKTRLFSALAEYHGAGDSLVPGVIEQVAELAGPDDDHAEIVRTIASALQSDLADFPELEISLKTEIGFLLASFETARGWIELEMMSGGTLAGASEVSSAASPVARLRAAQVLVAATRTQLGVLGWTVVVLSESVCDALDAMAALLEARIGTFVAYLGVVEKVTDLNVAADVGQELAEAAADSIADEAAERIVEKALEQIPGVGVGIAVVNVTREILKKKAELDERRRMWARVHDAFKKRNISDETLDLWTHVSRENALLEGLSTDFSVLGGALLEMRTT